MILSIYASRRAEARGRLKPTPLSFVKLEERDAGVPRGPGGPPYLVGPKLAPLLCWALATVFVSVASAQPVGDVLEKARVKIDELSAKLAKVKGPADVRVDAEVYLKAG